MKYGKYVLYSIAGLLLILLGAVYIGALFMKGEYQVERSIRIQRPPEAVYEKVADLREWRKWNPWSRGSDTNVYKGPEKGKGSVWEWHSKKHGNGELRIVSSKPYKKIETRIQFKDSTMTGKGSWRFERKGSETKVIWGTSGTLGYPFGRIAGWIQNPENLIGKDLKKGLENLKRHLEEGVRLNAGPIEREARVPG